MPRQTTQKPPPPPDIFTIVAGLAHAAHFSRQAWLHLEALLPMVRVVCPEQYESFAYLIVGSFQSWQTLEGAADDIMGPVEIDGKPAKRVHGVDPGPVVIFDE